MGNGEIVVVDLEHQLVSTDEVIPDNDQECVIWFREYQIPVLGFRQDENWYQIRFSKKKIIFELVEAIADYWMPIPRAYQRIKR
jgi:hypothetical protein